MNGDQLAMACLSANGFWLFPEEKIFMKDVKVQVEPE
jgi:hypothetical protein